jgi:hypothetical protein
LQQQSLHALLLVVLLQLLHAPMLYQLVLAVRRCHLLQRCVGQARPCCRWCSCWLRLWMIAQIVQLADQMTPV